MKAENVAGLRKALDALKDDAKSVGGEVGKSVKAGLDSIEAGLAVVEKASSIVAAAAAAKADAPAEAKVEGEAPK